MLNIVHHLGCPPAMVLPVSPVRLPTSWRSTASFSAMRQVGWPRYPGRSSSLVCGRLPANGFLALSFFVKEHLRFPLFVEISVVKPGSSCNTHLPKAHRIIRQSARFIGEYVTTNISITYLINLITSNLPDLTEFLVDSRRSRLQRSIRILIVHIDIIEQKHLGDLDNFKTDI